MQLVGVQATTGYDASKGYSYTELSSSSMTTVLQTAEFKVDFDRYMNPFSVFRQSLCLQSKIKPVTTVNDCDGGVFLEPSYDPTRREVIYRQTQGSSLAKDTTYQLTVIAPANSQDTNGFRAFDDAPLAANVSFVFKTTDTDPAGATVETPPSYETFCNYGPCYDACTATNPTVVACVDMMTKMNECNAGAGGGGGSGGGETAAQCQQDCISTCQQACPQGVFPYLRGCAYADCHASGLVNAMPVGPSEGLQLFTPEQIQSTAVGHVAHESEEGEHANTPDETPIRFGRAMPIIDPKNPGNSYLLYKLIINPRYTDGAAPSDAERARVHADFAFGLPMPGDGRTPVTQANLDLLSTWIAEGAPTHDCPGQ